MIWDQWGMLWVFLSSFSSFSLKCNKQWMKIYLKLSGRSVTRNEKEIKKVFFSSPLSTFTLEHKMKSVRRSFLSLQIRTDFNKSFKISFWLYLFLFLVSFVCFNSPSLLTNLWFPLFLKSAFLCINLDFSLLKTNYPY